MMIVVMTVVVVKPMVMVSLRTDSVILTRLDIPNSGRKLVAALIEFAVISLCDDVAEIEAVAAIIAASRLAPLLSFLTQFDLLPQLERADYI